ncbi:hypothetical protein [Spirosoma rhododendri]|uniref:Uncharacterized protein n=1 Tax=Spirosoma rhododendri TaxID=2728024 RepID=A0A7L5DY61_9BACT|nr:hypothetical protein [Spirosoma rhododendri]QJD80470.1 hypothetical protein HH216_20095 [Spirosoma rhododendri]
MSFTSLRIRFQTARSLPAPYAYFYTLDLRPAFSDFLQVDLSITYPDRDDIDDDELIAEGFTRDDDFSWSGRLPKAWLQAVAKLADQTTLQPADEDKLDEADDFWELKIARNPGPDRQGRPADTGAGSTDDWQYLVQELTQATLEADNRERPFELTYLRIGPDEAEVRVTASFAQRSVTFTTIRNRRERNQSLPWTALQKLMTAVYANDYDPDMAQPKRPKAPGQWLNLGTDEWYNISAFTDLTRTLENL